MSASFFHDSKLKYDNKGIHYTSGSLNSKLFKRYVDIFNDVFVVTRATQINDYSEVIGHSVSSRRKVHFSHINNLNIMSLLWGKNNQLIKQAIISTDISIIRLPSIIGIAAYITAIRYGQTVIIEMVGCPWDALWNYGKIRYKISAPLIYIINKAIIKHSNFVIYVTNSFLQKRYPTVGYSIGCSDVQLPKLKPGDLKDRLAENIKNPPGFTNGINLSTIANVSLNYKGQQYVIKAIKILKTKGYEINYHLIGAGSTKSLKKLAKKYGVEESLRFVGPLKHTDVLDYFKKVDIYIQPSNVDAAPRVILEAFNKACPVIGSSTGGIPELLDKRYVFKRKNVNDLVDKIENMINFGINDQAKRNYYQAVKFQDNYINNKRKKFYLKALKSNGIK
jgi:glycosyltransferase involved in cell wall biosynthesis